MSRSRRTDVERSWTTSAMSQSKKDFTSRPTPVMAGEGSFAEALYIRPEYSSVARSNQSAIPSHPARGSSKPALRAAANAHAYQ